MSSRVRCRPSTTGWPARSASEGADRRPLGRRAGSILALLVGLIWAGLSPAFAEKRIALVIGNAAYQGTMPPLKNPANDATDIAAALRARGFDVLRGTDANKGDFARLIDRYVKLARDADVSVFYYAGHAFQIDKQNYLVPVDAVIRKADDIATSALQLQSIVQGLEGSKGNHLIFLDACRNNPLKSSAGDASNLQDGLARISLSAGFLFAYATKPGLVAFDGGGRNSPFATAVLARMSTRGQDIASMMIGVRNDVIAATGGFQTPLEESSLTRQFYFEPGPADQVPPELQLFQLAASSRDPSLLGIYLQRYPDSPHAAEAKLMLGNMKLASRDVGTVRATSTATPDLAADGRLWQLAQRTRIRSLVEFYLTQNPNGQFVAEAKELLSSLPDENNTPPSQLCEKLATHPRDATANTSGVPLADLAKNATAAIEACEKARAESPEMPHFTALLARAMVAAGRRDEGIRLYREAAEKGNLRALVSLGLILETGDGIQKDVRTALSLYEKAADGGSPDGAINLAVALMGGVGGERNPARAVQLLKRAADAGSAIANFNLGVLIQDGVTGDRKDALAYFEKATQLGETRAFMPAAILLDEGRGVRKDPNAAAIMLLRGAACDSGETLDQLTKNAKSWSAATIKSVQERLKRAGYFQGPPDGKGGIKLAEPLTKWRRSGTLDPTILQ